ncbi:hypothetical protein SmJEL517_g03303 [Synchytrium microbalum]|uniref:Cell cycle checkpoint control protein RAD9A n=1 Tax=Synchytrium microbalum TaxID=1806994 RepID=A0A507C297_9FUNG|nr:uncharacterized protein SmJEL517_g03303 [Synchytrium microbalum]TPX33842.1 hypothetical protein SmJEL517_g03303 [Synchytrium microbalum]
METPTPSSAPSVVIMPSSKPATTTLQKTSTTTRLANSTSVSPAMISTRSAIPLAVPIANSGKPVTSTPVGSTRASPFVTSSQEFSSVGVSSSAPSTTRTGTKPISSPTTITTTTSRSTTTTTATTTNSVAPSIIPSSTPTLPSALFTRTPRSVKASPAALPTLGSSCTSACQGSSIKCIDSICQTSWKQPTWSSSSTPSNMLNGWSVSFFAWDAASQITANPDQSGDYVMRVVYPAGSRNPAASPVGGLGFYAEPLDLTYASVVTIQFDVYFPSNFNFVLGGKLPGLYGGATGCSGGASADSCFSSRHMWRTGGLGEAYLYVPVSEQPADFCSLPPLTICNSDFGVSLSRGAFTFATGKWNTIKQRIVLNSFDKNGAPNMDGGIQVSWSVDGNPAHVVIDYESMVWRQYESVTALAFGRFLTCLSRIGDDLQLDALDNKIMLWTVNSSRSAFCLFTLTDGFFDRIHINPQNQRQHQNGVLTGDARKVNCKLLLKPFMNIFKGKNNVDTVDRCKISITYDGADKDRLVVQLFCKHGVVKTHRLNYQASDDQKALYSKDVCRHKLVIPPKMLGELLMNFGTKLEEVTLRADQQSVVLKSFTELAIPGNNHRTDEPPRHLQTELSIDPEDFDLCEIQNEAEVTFGLKELKAIIHFAENSGEPLSAFFDQKGSPIIFSTSVTNCFVVDLALATIASVDASSQPSQTFSRQASQSNKSQSTSNPQTTTTSNPSSKRNSVPSSPRAGPIPKPTDPPQVRVERPAFNNNTPVTFNTNGFANNNAAGPSRANPTPNANGPPIPTPTSHMKPPPAPFGQANSSLRVTPPDYNIPPDNNVQLQEVNYELNYDDALFDGDLDDYLVGEHSYQEVPLQGGQQRDGLGFGGDGGGEQQQNDKGVEEEQVDNDDEEVPASPPRGPHVDTLLKRLEDIRQSAHQARTRPADDDDDEEIPPTQVPKK